MAAAAFRPMLAVAREEAAIISSETAIAARTTVTTEVAQVARQAGHEAFNPLAVREAAEASAQRVVHSSESSILSTLAHPPGTPSTPLNTTSTASVTSTLLAEARTEAIHASSHEQTLIGQVLEHDLGVTVREAMTNAGETGLQEVAEQTAEYAAPLLDGRKFVPQSAVAARAHAMP